MLELNKVYLGDCLEIMKEIPDGSIDMILSDIPYGIDHDDWDVLHNNTNSSLGGSSPAMYKTSFKRRGKPINGWSSADKKISIEYYKWCLGWTSELFRITKEGSPILLFCARRYQHKVASALEDSGFLIRDVLIWQKNKSSKKAQRIDNVLNKRGIFDSDYNNYRIGNLAPIYEPIIWAMKPYSKTLTDCVLSNKIGGFYCENDIIPTNILQCDVSDNKYHPTQKPLELIKKIIKLFSISEKHIILDMFIGSGTLGVACEELNRNFIGIEKEEKYFNISQERLGY